MMRFPAELPTTALIALVLAGLAELALRLLAPGSMVYTPFVHALAVVLALLPVFIVLLRQQRTLAAASGRAREAEAMVKARLALLDETLGRAQVAVFEWDAATCHIEVFGLSDPARRRFMLDEWLARCHPDDLAAVRRAWHAMLTGDATDHEEVYRVLSRSGNWRWQRVRATVASRDADGRARRVVGSTCDITTEQNARVQLIAGQRLLNSVLELLPIGVFWKDREGRYLGANRAFLEYYGIETALGRRDEDFVEPRQAALFRQHDESVMDGTFEERNALREGIHADGTRRWYNSSKVPLRDAAGHVVGVVGTFDDVTSLKRTEQTLRETSERFELALNGSSDGLWDWNLVTNEVYYSPRFKALLGYADDEYGNDFASYEARLHPDDRVLVSTALERHLSGAGDLDMEYRMRHRSGHWRWYRTRGLAVPDASGVRTRMAGTLSDVTERKARELEIAEARTHLVDATEALDSGIVMFDPMRRLVFCNSRYVEFYGLDAALVRPGVAYQDLLADFYARHPHARPGIALDDYAAELFARHRAGGAPWELELPERWLLISERPTEDGGVVCLHTDITHIKRTQRALEHALERAEGASRSKSQFVANVSHELRTPLNGVLGMLQLLDDGSLAPPQDEYVRVALQAGRALLGLINDVLDFARNDAGLGELADEVFSLPLLIDEVVAAHVRRATAKGLHLLPYVDPAVPERVHGDTGRLGQVLGNLLANAIKFTERGEIRIELRPDPAVTNGLCLSVDDTGIGIPLEAQAAIFEPFTQGDGSHTRRYGGTGLGLALTRQQLRLMGGDIQVQSSLDCGSRFECRFALKPAAAAPSPPARRVLVVGTASPSLPALQACLQRAGAEVTQAADCADAAGSLKSGVDWAFVDLALDAATLTRFTRNAAARGVRCVGYGAPADDLPNAAAACSEVLRTPIAHAAVLALLQAPADAAKHSAVLDEAHARSLKHTLGAEGFTELVTALDENITQRLDDYREARTVADVARVQQLTHAMKGVGANLGATRFAALCATVGQAAARGDLVDHDGALRESFAQALARLRGIAHEELRDARRVRA